MSPRSLTIYELVLKPYEANFTNTTTMPRYQKVLLAGNSGLAGNSAPLGMRIMLPTSHLGVLFDTSTTAPNITTVLPDWFGAMVLGLYCTD